MMALLAATGRELPELDHLLALSDDVGIAQHAVFDVPHRDTGYCVDDVARAFIVALTAAREPEYTSVALPLAGTYLAFLHHAQRPDGRFRNFMSYERTWLEQVGSEDSNGRAIWALGYGVRHAPSVRWQTLCARMLERALPAVLSSGFVRSSAFAALGLAYAQGGRHIPGAALAHAAAYAGARLRGEWELHRTRDWEWFEDEMTYDNARLPEALIRLGTAFGDRELVRAGLTAAEFLTNVVTIDGQFVPIGNEGWYRRSGRRALYSQQPLEAAAMVDLGLLAAEVDRDRRWRETAERAYGWFHGRNTLGIPLVRDGGCCDGLDESGANDNMGAESTLAYLSSAFALAQAPPAHDARP
jgi:hypothetical protein